MLLSSDPLSQAPRPEPLGTPGSSLAPSKTALADTEPGKPRPRDSEPQRAVVGAARVGSGTGPGCSCRCPPDQSLYLIGLKTCRRWFVNSRSFVVETVQGGAEVGGKGVIVRSIGLSPDPVIANAAGNRALLVERSPILAHTPKRFQGANHVRRYIDVVVQRSCTVSTGENH